VWEHNVTCESDEEEASSKLNKGTKDSVVLSDCFIIRFRSQHNNLSTDLCIDPKLLFFSSSDICRSV